MLIEAEPRFKAKYNSTTAQKSTILPSTEFYHLKSAYTFLQRLGGIYDHESTVNSRWHPYRHSISKPRHQSFPHQLHPPNCVENFKRKANRYFTANANENNDNVSDITQLPVANIPEKDTEHFCKIFNFQKKFWRHRKKSFNTNPLSSQEENSATSKSSKYIFSSSFGESADNFADFPSIVDNRTDHVFPENFASTFHFNQQNYPTIIHKQSSEHIRLPLDLSSSRACCSTTNLAEYSEHRGQPLNRNTNATVCAEPAPTFIGNAQHANSHLHSSHFHFAPSNHKFLYKDLSEDSCGGHFSRPINAEDIFQSSKYCNRPSISLASEENKGLLVKHSKDGILLALTKKNARKNNPRSYRNSDKVLASYFHGLSAQGNCNNYQPSFSQNNATAAPSNSFKEFIKRASSNQSSFRPLRPESPQFCNNIFDCVPGKRILDIPRSFLPADMGCIQSIAKSKVGPGKYHGIIVDDIQATIDRNPTEIEEKSPIVLRYRTPYFRASASVIVPPIRKEETWTIGWIQACDAMKFVNQYGDMGSSSWEIPALKQRLVPAVSDSDGVSYPWYGNTTEIATIEGPTETPRHLLLRMNDNFYPSVTWDIPVSEGSEAHLTHIVRDQSFTTWLAAVNQTTGHIEVLRTVKWHFLLEIVVDPTQKLGKRSKIVSSLEQQQPIILPHNTDPVQIVSPRRAMNGKKRKTYRRQGDNNSNNHVNEIPKSALVRPSANNAQTLIWRPRDQSSVVVVPPKEEYKENNEIVWFTREPLIHGKEQNVRILTKDELLHLRKTVC